MVNVPRYALADEVAEPVGGNGVELAAISFEVLGVPVALPLGFTSRKFPLLDLLFSDGYQFEVDLAPGANSRSLRSMCFAECLPDGS